MISSPQSKPHSQYIFREAKPEDIPRLKYIRDHVRENALVSISIEISDYEKAFFEDGKAWVCLEENTIVGFCCGRIKQKDVWALFLDEKHEGQGLGNHLMQILENWMFQNGCKEIFLTTWPETRADFLYRKRGWEDLGLLKNGEVQFRLKAKL